MITTKKDICWMSALDLLKSIKEGEVSPVEIVDAVIDRIKSLNPEINAIVTLTEESARKSAEEAERAIRKREEELGALYGIPVTIKDNIFTKGIRTTFGSKLYENYIPNEDAILVERLKRAGAIVIGKTNSPEFALIPITDNPVFGPTRNPWDKSRTPGGSSGGAAAAIASGMGPLAVGNDGGGSIRIPASLCGVYGFKPSFGRIPRYPTLPGWETMASEGPITRTVSDAALMMDVMVGPDDRDRFSLPQIGGGYLENLEKEMHGKKLAYSSNLGYAVVDPEVEEITRKAAFSFTDLGYEVSEVKPEIPNMEGDLITMVVSETITAIDEYSDLETWKKVAYPLYLGFLPLGESISFKDYIRIHFKREELWRKLRRIFDEYDFLLTPTTAVPAFKIEEGMGPTEIAGKSVGPIGWMPFTYPFNFTGQPAASIPCGFTKDRLPVGLQIIGDRYDDLGVLQASRAFEKAFPWQDKKPPFRQFRLSSHF